MCGGANFATNCRQSCNRSLRTFAHNFTGPEWNAAVNLARTRIAAALIASSLAMAPAIAGTVLPGTACLAFPDNGWWHADISTLPVHARSQQWMSHMSPTRLLHPDFGPSYGAQTVPYGIPITLSLIHI